MKYIILKCVAYILALLALPFIATGILWQFIKIGFSFGVVVMEEVEYILENLNEHK